jgi:hypothetical protein
VDGVVYRGLPLAQNARSTPINTLSGRFRCVRELRDLTTRANANQKPHVSSFATRGGTLHYCSQISRVVTNNITGNQAFSFSPHLTPDGCLVASPLPPLEHVAMDSTKSRSISFGPFPIPSPILYPISGWAKGQAGLGRSSLQLN